MSQRSDRFVHTQSVPAFLRLLLSRVTRTNNPYLFSGLRTFTARCDALFNPLAPSPPGRRFVPRWTRLFPPQPKIPGSFVIVIVTVIAIGPINPLAG